MGALLQSKAILQSFCLELQKKLNMRYQSPPLPVDLKMTGGIPPQLMGGVPPGIEARTGEDALGRDPLATAYDDMQEPDLDAVAAIFDGK
jgi:hypothetical protein